MSWIVKLGDRYYTGRLGSAIVSPLKRDAQHFATREDAARDAVDLKDGSYRLVHLRPKRPYVGAQLPPWRAHGFVRGDWVVDSRGDRRWVANVWAEGTIETKTSPDSCLLRSDSPREVALFRLHLAAPYVHYRTVSDSEAKAS